MTKKELEQLIILKSEIKQLENKILELERKKTKTTTDVVDASGSCFPYLYGRTTVKGYDVAAAYNHSRIIDDSIKLLKERKLRAEKLEYDIYRFIDTIDDSRTRIIMQYRYIDGYKLNKIAKLMHCDKSYPDKIINAYLDKINNRKQ